MTRHGVITLDGPLDLRTWMTFTGHDARIVAMTRHAQRVTVTFTLREREPPAHGGGHMFALRTD